MLAFAAPRASAWPCTSNRKSFKRSFFSAAATTSSCSFDCWVKAVELVSKVISSDALAFLRGAAKAWADGELSAGETRKLRVRTDTSVSPPGVSPLGASTRAGVSASSTFDSVTALPLSNLPWSAAMPGTTHKQASAPTAQWAMILETGDVCMVSSSVRAQIQALKIIASALAATGEAVGNVRAPPQP